ncbi:MAG: hypothetical protein JSV88_04925 [Candidatus Aminicenantes bacterium]|nr:MAG: hypothetical protein JSV88_04925 [Candidatus Aminicenantes bacterium]
MKKVTLLIFLLMFVFIHLLNAKKVANLPEVMKPVSIAVDGSQLFITDSTNESTIHIYSLQPFTHVKTFGKPGEGPGEFMSLPHLTVYPDHLLINGMKKLQTFSRDGAFQKEMKLPFMHFYFYYPLLSIGDRYVRLRLEPSEEEKKFIFKADLLDKNFDLVKKFYQGGPPQILPPRRGAAPQKKELDVVYDYLDLAISGNRIFIADSRKGFFIAVFDHQGNMLYEINKAYSKLKIPGEFKEDFMQEQRRSPNWERLKQMFNYKFKEYFPAFFSFKIDNQKIYVTTYEKKGNNYEIVILDLEGNILKRSSSFPLHPLQRISRRFVSYSNEYDIVDDKIYYLIENKDTEEWELHAVEIR